MVMAVESNDDKSVEISRSLVAPRGSMVFGTKVCVR